MVVLKDKKFLNIFWTLSATDGKKRENAIKNLLQQFSEASKNSDDIRTYTVERLVKGLKSIRNLAQVGFGTGLCAILENYSSEIDRDHLMELVKSELFDASTETKAEGTAQKIGQLFIVSVLCRTGLLKKSSLEEVQWLLEPLIPLLEQQDFRSIAAFTIASLISRVKKKVFAALLPSLEDALTAGWDNADPDALLLVLSAASAHPDQIDRKWLRRHWNAKRGLLASEEHLTTALALLDRSFEGREGALAAPHPLGAALAASGADVIAPLWKMALERAGDGESSGGEAAPATSRSKAAQVRAKAALLHLFCEAVLANPQEPDVLTTIGAGAAELLRKQLARPQLALHPLAARFAGSQFLVWCERASLASRSALFSLLSGAIVDFDRELPPNLRLVQPLLHRVDREALVAFGEALTEAYATSAHRPYLANQLRLLIISGEALLDEDVRRLLLFMAEPLMGHSRPHQADPLVAAFFKSLEWLSGAKRYRHLGRYLRVVLRPVVKRGVALDGGRAAGAVGAALQRALELCPRKKKEEEEAEEAGGRQEVRWMFGLLFAQLALHALADARGMEALLADVTNCFEKAEASEGQRRARRKGRKEEEPHWTEVMTDCLLSLLSQGSRLLRSLVRLAFSRMTSRLTPTCAGLLEDVLLTRVEQKSKKELEEAEEEDDLLDFQHEEDDEEEEEENEGGKEEETETNGMEVEESEESSEEEEEEEEEGDGDNPALTRVRENVRSALGKAALGDAEEDAGSDMDDATMFRLDSAIVAAFRAASKGGNTKMAVQEKKRQLLLLKSRCLDLVEIVLSQSIDPAVIEPCLLACVEMLRRPDDAGLKVAETIASLKKRQLPMAASEPQQVEVLRDGVRALLHLGHRAPSVPDFFTSFATSAIFLMKSLPLTELQPVMENELAQLAEEKTQTGRSMLAILFQRYPPLGWSIKGSLVEWSRKADVRPFNRTQFLILLRTVLKFNSKSEGIEEFLAVCVGLADELFEVADTWKHPALAQRVAQLAAAVIGDQTDPAVRDRLSAAAQAKLPGHPNADVRNALRMLIKRGLRVTSASGPSAAEKKKVKEALRKQKRAEKAERKTAKARRRAKRRLEATKERAEGAQTQLGDAPADLKGEEQEEGESEVKEPQRKRRRKAKTQAVE